MATGFFPNSTKRLKENSFSKTTLPETNVDPENGWLEYDPFLLGQKAYFQGRTDGFGECNCQLLMV